MITSLKKFMLVVSFIFCTYHCFSQSLERFVIGSSGTFQSDSAINIDFTVGESLVTSLITPNLNVTQGFQQQDTFFLTHIKILNNNQIISVYPNPAQIKIHISSDELQASEIIVCDACGRVYFVQKIFGEIEKNAVIAIDISNLISGNYFVQIIDNKKGNLFNAKFIKL